MPAKSGTRSESSTTTQLESDILAGVIGVIRELADVVKEQVTRREHSRERSDREGSDIYEWFCCMGPPEFMGTSNPIEAENWIL